MKFFACLLLCLLCTGAFAQPARLLHSSYAAKYSYCDSLRDFAYKLSEDKANDTFGKLTKWAVVNGDPELAAEFSLAGCSVSSTQIKNKRYAALEKKLTQIVEAAVKNKNEYLLAEAYQTLGTYYWNISIHSKAFECLLNAYKIYSKFSPDQFPSKREFSYSLGNLYYRYDDVDNAITYLKEALNTWAGNDHYFYAINNSLGLCYRRLNKYDTSGYYFQTIYTAAVKKNDTIWIGISMGNIGINYFLQRKYDQAIPLLEKDIEVGMAGGVVRNAANSMCILATIYFEQGKYTDAERLLLNALRAVESKSFWPNYELAEHLYMQLHKVYEAEGNYKNSSMYADSALVAKDSFASQYNTLNFSKAQEKVEFTQHQFEISKLSDQKKLQQLISASLIAGIIALCIIAILFVNRQRIKNKILQNEKKLLETERDNASKQLNAFTQHIQEKNKLIEQFASEIDQFKKTEEQDVDHETIIKLQQSTILTDEQWDNFRVLFEKVHKGFFNRIKEKMPDLTPAEIRFLALTKLKLSPKEMASMLGISANSIRNYRHRLRRKLGLSEEANIEDLSETI